MKFGRLCFLPLVACLCLAASAQSDAKDYSAIDGNWHLTGEDTPSQYPYLAIAMGVHGNTIYGQGDIHMQCGRGATTAVEFSVTGQIAADGSFLLTGTWPQFRLAIRGKVPAAGASTWAASVTCGGLASVGDGTKRSCEGPSGGFAATLIPPLDGTYAGTVSGKGLDAPITVSATIAQGEFTSGKRSASEPETYYTPLRATITVNGLPEPLTGEAIAWPNSRIVADSVFLTFHLEDGSNLSLGGYFTDSSRTTLQVTISLSGGGKNPQVQGSGKLILQ